MSYVPTQTLVVATNNAHKAGEFKEILGDSWEVMTAKDIGDIEWDENGSSFFENSEIKAVAVSQRLPDSLQDALVIADDSGICVEALNGEPGIYSSRYAGEDGNDKANNHLLLNNLSHLSEESARKAHFICALTIYQNGKRLHQIEGRMDGVILESPSGSAGFGYDPLFKPSGYNKSAAELPKEEKNSISHRGLALKKFSQWLGSL